MNLGSLCKKKGKNLCIYHLLKLEILLTVYKNQSGESVSSTYFDTMLTTHVILDSSNYTVINLRCA